MAVKSSVYFCHKRINIRQLGRSGGEPNPFLILGKINKLRALGWDSLVKCVLRGRMKSIQRDCEIRSALVIRKVEDQLMQLGGLRGALEKIGNPRGLPLHGIQCNSQLVCAIQILCSTSC